MDYIYEIEIKGEKLVFLTEKGLFSPMSADTGTLAMLDFVSFKAGQKVLDLGCGYGLAGIYAARKTGPDTVWMLDIEPEAISKCRQNAANNNVMPADYICSDGPELLLQKNLGCSFDFILSNPPYHTDFSVARRFIETGYKLLADGGHLVMVVKRLVWYRNKIKHVFGGASIIQKNGYYVISAQKRLKTPYDRNFLGKAERRPAKSTRKHRKKLALKAAEIKKKTAT